MALIPATPLMILRNKNELPVGSIFSCVFDGLLNKVW